MSLMSCNTPFNNTAIDRRRFVSSTVMTLALPSVFAQSQRVEARFGMVTDPHYADRDPNGSRHYRESLAKMRECIAFMNAQSLDFLIELGDFKDENAPAEERKTLSFLETMEVEFRAYRGTRYHVFGNHDLDSISKQQFLSRVENTGIDPNRSYYGFRKNDIQYLVLDACFRGDGMPYNRGNFDWTDANLPEEQRKWLKAQLERADVPVIVFVHQLLSGSGNVYINHAEEIRALLEACGRVAAVFHGHHHAGDYQQIEGIHYYTLKAMVEGSGMENSAYSVVSIGEDAIRVEGYRRAESRTMAHSPAAP